MRLSLVILLLFCLPGASLLFAQDETMQSSKMVDERDGQTYRTVRIGDQVWMAENLNYGKVVNNCMQTNNGIPEKTLYENDRSTPKIYGGLYTWNEAMNWQKGDGSQGICPKGWHIPSLAEWKQLIHSLGADSAGQLMKSSKDDNVSWDGSNRSGFSAIPSGVGYQNYFSRKGHWAVYWSSTEMDEDFAWYAQLDGFWYPEPPKYRTLYLGQYFLKDNAFCIRCIKDNN